MRDVLEDESRFGRYGTYLLLTPGVQMVTHLNGRFLRLDGGGESHNGAVSGDEGLEHSGHLHASCSDSVGSHGRDTARSVAAAARDAE